MKRYGNQFPGFHLLESENPYETCPPKDEKEISLDMMIQVGKLGVGVGFGELALMNDSPRSATIKTEEDCQFAIVNKGDFKEIMDKIYK